MEWSFPWLSIDGDRKYDDNDFAQFFESLFSYGVSLTTKDALKVSVSPNGGMKIQVESGFAFMGKVYLNSTPSPLSITVAGSTQDRVDSIVVRMDKGARKSFLAVKKGDVSVTRTSDIYELQLATIKIPRNVSSITADLITDKRSDTKVCGYSSPFQKVNVSGLEDQYKTMLQKIVDSLQSFADKNEEDFLKLFQQVLNEFQLFSDQKKTELTNEVQNIIDDGTAKVNAFDVLIHEWFENLKNELDENQVINLQNQINKLQATEPLPAIKHDRNNYPKLQIIYWEYGIGLTGLANEPTGIGGSNVIEIPHSVEYLDPSNFKVLVPSNYKMVNPEITKIDNNTVRMIEAYKVIEIRF